MTIDVTNCVPAGVGVSTVTSFSDLHWHLTVVDPCSGGPLAGINVRLQLAAALFLDPADPAYPDGPATLPLVGYWEQETDENGEVDFVVANSCDVPCGSPYSFEIHTYAGDLICLDCLVLDGTVACRYDQLVATVTLPLREECCEACEVCAAGLPATLVIVDADTPSPGGLTLTGCTACANSGVVWSGTITKTLSEVAEYDPGGGCYVLTTQDVTVYYVVRAFGSGANVSWSLSKWVRWVENVSTCSDGEGGPPSVTGNWVVPDSYGSAPDICQLSEGGTLPFFGAGPMTTTCAGGSQVVTLTGTWTEASSPTLPGLSGGGWTLNAAALDAPTCD